MDPPDSKLTCFVFSGNYACNLPHYFSLFFSSGKCSFLFFFGFVSDVPDRLRRVNFVPVSLFSLAFHSFRHAVFAACLPNLCADKKKMHVHDPKIFIMIG